MQPAENSALSPFSEPSGRWGNLLRGAGALAVLSLLYILTDLPATAETLTAQIALLLGVAAGLVFAFCSAGTALTFLAGGGDLSTGGTIVCSLAGGGVALRLAPDSPAAFCAGVLVSGIVCGGLNGWLTGVLRLNAYLVTFLTGLFFVQIASLLPMGEVSALTRDWKAEDRGSLLFIGGLALAGLLLLAGILKYTVFGRHLRAVGSNLQVAKECGIAAARIRFFSYVLSGLLASAFVFPLILLGYWPLPFAISTGLLFPVVALVGGFAAGGGRGGMLGLTLTGLLAGGAYFFTMRAGPEHHSAVFVLSLIVLTLLTFLLRGRKPA